MKYFTAQRPGGWFEGATSRMPVMSSWNRLFYCGKRHLLSFLQNKK